MQEIANYWAAYVDLSMYQWSDGSEVTLASFPAKFGVVGPVFKPAYYATWMPFHAPLVMTPPGWRARYYFDDTLDFKWGYSVPTYANRIALCLDNDRTGGSPQYNWHAAKRDHVEIMGVSEQKLHRVREGPNRDLRYGKRQQHPGCFQMD